MFFHGTGLNSVDDSLLLPRDRCVPRTQDGCSSSTPNMKKMELYRTSSTDLAGYGAGDSVNLSGGGASVIFAITDGATKTSERDITHTLREGYKFPKRRMSIRRY